MTTIETIANRRSVRRFGAEPVPEEVIRTVLEAARQAPSGKNRQPWRFVVVEGDRVPQMIGRMEAVIEAARERGDDLGSSLGTMRAMAQAPVTVFIVKPGGMPPWITRSIEQAFEDVVDHQSIGAAIQNMVLAATELGIGSLWICDVFYAYDELMDWLEVDGQLIAAVSLGYPAESPAARPRKSMDELVVWLGREQRAG